MLASGDGFGVLIKKKKRSPKSSYFLYANPGRALKTPQAMDQKENPWALKTTGEWVYFSFVPIRFIRYPV